MVKVRIDLDHLHKGMKPHVHHGYYHSEYEVSKKGGTKPNTKEKKLIKFIDKAWKDKR